MRISRKDVACLLGLVLSAASLAASRPPDGPVVEVQNCGGAAIEVADADFPTAFHVTYTVKTTAPICVMWSRYAGLPESTVEMWPSSHEIGDIANLSNPLWFRKVRPAEVDQTPRMDPATVWESSEARVGTVPAGTYRLVLRYVPAPCGRRLFSEVCVAESSEFAVNGPMRFGVER